MNDTVLVRCAPKSRSPCPLWKQTKTKERRWAAQNGSNAMADMRHLDL